PNSSAGLAQPCGFAGLLSRTGRCSALFWRKKGPSDRLEDLAGAENRAQPDSLTREGIGSAFLAIDDAHRRSYGQTGLAQRLDRVQQRAPGGDHILDETHGF